MIRIPISTEQKNEIEDIYWKWISQYHLKDLCDILKKDAVFNAIVMQGEKDIKKALKKFLLADYIELKKIKYRIDKSKTAIDKTTKEYLLNRYKNYRDSQAAKIVKVMDITVCPYCNQNHLNIYYDKDGNLRLWGDMDHFYDKSTYPALAICLYNLIPVCKICNQIKSSAKRLMDSPYNSEKTSKITFKTEFDEKFDLDYLQGKSANFNIVIDKKNLDSEDLEEIKLFDLEKRYKQLKRNAQEIIIKSKAYESIYEKHLKDEFSLSDEELRAYIFGYTQDHRNRILSKFNFDIMNEFR